MVKPRILVTGFQRSGTTLTRRLIEFHPDVQKIFHEKRILNSPKEITKIKYDVWGDKVPWNSGSGHEIIDYSKRWVATFGNAHRIVHVIRKPSAVARSNQRTGMIPYNSALASRKRSVPKVSEFLCSYNYMSFKYEDLVLSPETVLTGVFSFCGLEVNEEILNYVMSPKEEPYFIGIKKDRV